jgi:sporulation protein YlmC with PRC-barrel domain
LSRYRRPTSAAFAAGASREEAGHECNIFNSKGIHVGTVTGAAIFDLKGENLYDLKGVNIYRMSGELVGHLNDAHGSEKRLDRSTDRLFPVRGSS